MTTPQMHARWHELVIKHALGTITDAEAAKLERYQALVHRENRQRNGHTARLEYAHRLILKQFGSFKWENERIW